jgi:two-component system chemotaxis response regulator CheB
MADSGKNTGKRSPIRLLVVEDSPSVREFLVYLFASDQSIRVIATASNGEEALEAVRTHKPDIIAMDLHMPKMDGYAATRTIMENYPTPIVIVTGSSSSTTNDTAATLTALEAGALAVTKRPPGIGHPDHIATARELIQTIKLMSEIKVVKRWARPKSAKQMGPESAFSASGSGHAARIVAIGSSTGGPLVLQQILSGLPRRFPLPIVIVQHIAEGFSEGFAEWLDTTTGFPTHLGVHGMELLPGHAYVIPSGIHGGVDRHGCLSLKEGCVENGHCPSVSYLFRSVAQAYGKEAIGILLTGMGHDGAAELGLMRSLGAVTIAQDKQSSVVHGMPGAAIAQGAAVHVLNPEKMIALLAESARALTPS